MSPEDIAKAAAEAEKATRELRGVDPTAVQQFDQSAYGLYFAQYQAEYLRRGESPDQAKDKADFWARLKIATPDAVGPGEDIMAGYYAEKGRKPYDSIGEDEYGRATIIPGYQSSSPVAAASASITSAGAPPTILEYSRSQWLGMNRPVNRFSLNPGREYYAEIPGTPPTMFGGGRDLPVITGSGVSPETLAWVAWPLRHTAAFAPGRADVALLIEASLEGDPDSWESLKLQSDEGKAALQNYFGRIAMWVSTPADEDQELTEDDYRAFYPSENND
jgi:hypothetical protein